MATMANRSAATQSGDADEEDFEDSKDMAINITFDLIHKGPFTYYVSRRRGEGG